VITENSDYKNATPHCMLFLERVANSNPVAAAWLFANRAKWVFEFLVQIPYENARAIKQRQRWNGTGCLTVSGAGAGYGPACGAGDGRIGPAAPPCHARVAVGHPSARCAVRPLFHSVVRSSAEPDAVGAHRARLLTADVHHIHKYEEQYYGQNAWRATQALQLVQQLTTTPDDFALVRTAVVQTAPCVPGADGGWSQFRTHYAEFWHVFDHVNEQRLEIDANKRELISLLHLLLSGDPANARLLADDEQRTLQLLNVYISLRGAPVKVVQYNNVTQVSSVCGSAGDG
jgi:hypothetical protein